MGHELYYKRPDGVFKRYKSIETKALSTKENLKECPKCGSSDHLQIRSTEEPKGHRIPVRVEAHVIKVNPEDIDTPEKMKAVAKKLHGEIIGKLMEGVGECSCGREHE